MNYYNIWWTKTRTSYKRIAIFIIIISIITISLGLLGDSSSQALIDANNLSTNSDMRISATTTGDVLKYIESIDEIKTQSVLNKFEDNKVAVSKINRFLSIQSFLFEERINDSLKALADQRQVISFTYLIDQLTWSNLKLDSDSDVIFASKDGYIRNINDTYYSAIGNNVTYSFSSNNSIEVTWIELNNLLLKNDIRSSSDGIVLVKIQEFYQNVGNPIPLWDFSISMHLSIFFDYKNIDLTDIKSIITRTNRLFDEYYLTLNNRTEFSSITISIPANDKLILFREEYLYHFQIYAILLNLLLFLMLRYGIIILVSLINDVNKFTKKINLLNFRDFSSKSFRRNILLISISIFIFAYYLISQLILSVLALIIPTFFIKSFIEIALILYLFNTGLYLFKQFQSEINAFTVLIFIFSTLFIIIEFNLTNNIIVTNLLLQAVVNFLLLSTFSALKQISDDYLIKRNLRILNKFPSIYLLLVPTNKKKIIHNSIFILFLVLVMLSSIFITNIDLQEDIVDYQIGSNLVVSGFNNITEADNWAIDHDLNNYTIKTEARLYILVNGINYQLNVQGIEYRMFGENHYFSDYTKEKINLMQDLDSILIDVKSTKLFEIGQNLLFENHIKSKRIETNIVSSVDFWPGFIPMEGQKTDPYFITSLSLFQRLVNLTTETAYISYSIASMENKNILINDTGDMRIDVKFRGDLISENINLQSIIKLETTFKILYIIILIFVFHMIRMQFISNLKPVMNELYTIGYTLHAIRRTLNITLLLQIVYSLILTAILFVSIFSSITKYIYFRTDIPFLKISYDFTYLFIAGILFGIIIIMGNIKTNHVERCILD